MIHGYSVGVLHELFLECMCDSISVCNNNNNNNNNNRFKVCFGVGRRHRRPLSPRNQQQCIIGSKTRGKGESDGKGGPVSILTRRGEKKGNLWWKKMLKDMEDRRRVLARAKNLKKADGMQGYYIVPDLTKIQQDEDKKLKNEVKSLREAGNTFARISRGVVVTEARESNSQGARLV